MSLTIVINARVNSTRVPMKLLRTFGGTTILDIALEKIARLDCLKYVATCEDEIRGTAEKYGIPILDRSEQSVQKGFRDQRITFAHYKSVETSHIMSINPCCPFVKLSTYERAIRDFSNGNCKTMTTVKKLDNIFFDENMSPLNVVSKAVSTLNNRPIYEMAHLFHIFDRDAFLDKGYFWDYSDNNPGFFIVSKAESVDIDDMVDFQIAESIYENTSSNSE